MGEGAIFGETSSLQQASDLSCLVFNMCPVYELEAAVTAPGLGFPKGTSCVRLMGQACQGRRGCLGTWCRSDARDVTVHLIYNSWLSESGGTPVQGPARLTQCRAMVALQRTSRVPNS